MDFLKKAQKKMKEYMDDNDQSKHQNGSSSQYPQGQYNNSINHAAPPPHQDQYGQAPLPPSPLPPGWLAQWDQNSQRYFYVEQQTGRTQWEPPVASYGGGVPSSGYGQPQKHGLGGSTVAAGVGGLAVGAIGGAILSHELNENSHDHHSAASYDAPYGAPAGSSGYGAPSEDPYQASMPPPVPGEMADGSSMSIRDREEIEEKREELEEAQEEYNEAVEEGYDD